MNSAGDLYVSDAGNSTIRKVTSTGVVTTLAGTPGQFGSSDGTDSFSGNVGGCDGGLGACTKSDLLHGHVI